jgi:serine/threonine protein kinase
MEPLIQDVLNAAGVDTSHHKSTRDAWKEFLDASSESCMEMLAPFSSAFYQAIAALLIHGWNSPISLQQDMEEQDDESLLSLLASQVQAVQVTQWLRTMADFRVAAGPDSSFSSILLLQQHPSSSSSSSSQTTHVLLQALFHHVSSLPLLQQEIHYQAQQSRQQATISSRRRQQHASSNVVVSSRLEQYQAIQRRNEILLQQLNQHILELEYILGEWYLVGGVEIRGTMRRLLARVWSDFVKMAQRPTTMTRKLENTSAAGIAMTLRLLLRILQGSSSSFSISSAVHRHLLFHQLIPLHQPNSMVLWRDQTCLLELYHEPLVQCMAVLLQKHTEWIPLTIQALLGTDIWSPNTTNTPKIILLLHQIDTFVSMGNTTEIWKPHDSIYHSLLLRVSQCASSDNSRMAERALQFFRNEVWCQLVLDDEQQHYATSVPILLQALVQQREGAVPWNPTVRKMTHRVLEQLQRHDEQKFAMAANEVFGNGCGGGDSNVTLLPAKTTNDEEEEEEEEDTDGIKDVPMQEPQPASSIKDTTTTTASSSLQPSRFSLKAGMGQWRPPRTSAPAHAKHGLMGPPKARPPQTLGNMGTSAAAPPPPPPLTITGVAPWAMESSSFGQHKRNAGQAHLVDSKPTPPSVAAIVEENEKEEEQEQIGGGLQRVLNYMKELKPATDEKDDDGTSPWAKAQMAETPTLLPSLKFHDLVFGHDLGKGAFGNVKYARQIDKSTTRSHWAEFAVKIISTAKIVEMGYEASVQREIATLRVLSHPCIARLVSSFRFGDGAYLVLEYASGGDLHSLISNKGSLDQDSTRFVIGEVISALASIHDLGFVYGDLKPENVLITETGHIKLTDFGGCRPLTEAAKDLIRPSGKHLLKELRDGDWKERPSDTGDNDEEMENVSSDTPMDDDDDEEEEDLRIEGTTAYLPPEVVLGESPTAAADSWALGCVMYQCLSGRPPLLDNDDHATRQKIVTFHLDESHKQQQEAEEDSDPLFLDAHASDIAPIARQLIRKLLSPRDERPNMMQVSDDPFFEGTNVFHLHRQPAVPLDVGTVAPVEDATWTRRQYSSIWAPQPKAYDISVPEPMHLSNPMLASKAPIPEGDEANVFFSWRSTTTTAYH